MANTTSENSVDGKKMTELKVVELRSELEKRGLDKTGIKAVLMERLEKVGLSIYFINEILKKVPRCCIWSLELKVLLNIWKLN